MKKFFVTVTNGKNYPDLAADWSVNATTMEEAIKLAKRNLGRKRVAKIYEKTDKEFHALLSNKKFNSETLFLDITAEDID